MNRIGDFVSEIRVVNERRVGKFLGAELRYDENLLQNDECLAKLAQYNKYFTKNITSELFTDFYAETGLNLAYEIGKPQAKEKDTFHISKYGYTGPKDKEWYKQVRNEDILVKIYVDEIGELPSPERKEAESELSDTIRELNYSLSQISNPAEKAELVAKYMGEEFERTGVKQILVNPFGEIYIIYEDGRMLRDFKPYEENVDGIFAVDSSTAYLIFKDSAVEPLYWHKEAAVMSRDKYDKVVFDDYFLGLLKADHLILITVAWGMGQADTSVISLYSNVKDMELDHTDSRGQQIIGDIMIETKLHIKTKGGEIVLNGTPMVNNDVNG